MATEHGNLAADGAKLRDVIRLQLRHLGISAREASRRAGLNVGYVGDVLEGRSKTPEADRITKLAAALEIDEATLTGGAFVPSLAAPERPKGATRMMPLFAARFAVETPFVPMAAEPIDYVAPLPTLTHVTDAYAVTVPNSLNDPRYLPGETVYVSPVAMVRGGDFVFARRKDGQSIIARCVGMTESGFQLACLTQSDSVFLASDDVVSLHRIVGSFG